MTMKFALKENEKDQPLNPNSLQPVISDIPLETPEVSFPRKMVSMRLNSVHKSIYFCICILI